MSDILTGTPPELTYLHPLVGQAWQVVWAVTSGALVVILGWIGLTLIMQSTSAAAQAGKRWGRVPCSASSARRVPCGGAP